MADPKSNPAQAEASAANPERELAGGLAPEPNANAEAASAVEATAADASANPAPETTTTPPEDAPAQPRLAKVDVEGYENLKRAALSPRKGPETTANPPAEEDSEPAKAAPEIADAPVDGTAPVPPEDDPDKAPDRVRLGRLKDDGEKKRINNAVQLAADEDISFDEAYARITGKAAGQAPAAAEAAPEAPKFRTEAEIKADIAAKKAEKKTAADNLDTGAMYAADEEIDTLREELSASQREADQAQSRATQRFDATVKSSWATAGTLYPIEDAKFAAKMTEIADRLERAKNPLAFAAESPLEVAHMAANELKIAPRDPKAPKTTSQPSPSTSATKPAAVQQRAVVRSTQPAGATPASGAARTTQGNAQPLVDFEKIKSVDDYEKAKETLLRVRA